jgi:flagellar hook-associated protein 1
VAKLRAEPSADDASRTQLKLTVGSGSIDLTGDSLGGGKLSGLLRFRDEDLASASAQIGRIAVVMGERFNQLQDVGVDATGAAGRPMFSVAAPKVLASAGNTGNQALEARVSDVSLLKASDYKITFDGTNYTVTRIADGMVTTPLTLPITSDGLEFTAAAGGAMAAGDSFLVRPYADAGSSFKMLLASPTQLATGFSATVQSGADNQGQAKVLDFSVQSRLPANATPVTVTFTTPTQYTLSGGASGSGTYVAGNPITANGWSLTLNGPAAAGDTFAVGPTSSPQVDNRNVLDMLGLASARSVDGATFNEAYAGLIGDTGVRVQSARQASALSGQVLSDAVSRQQGVAGVNLDEEASNLLRYQQAYQASAKLIQTAQTLFDTLIASVGR